TVWLLGSSDYSARLAAELGLPYVFANHFSGAGIDQVLAPYRDGYRPSDAPPEPRTFLTVNAVVAPTLNEAEERALPQLRAMARLRTGRPMGRAETVEEALATPLDGLGQQMVDDMRSRWVVGEPEVARQEVADLAAR